MHWNWPSASRFPITEEVFLIDGPRTEGGKKSEAEKRKEELSVILLVVMFSVPAAAENNTPKHIPRIVSIVFDDSGSMYDKVARWAYASYAMQSFCAMMGESDELYVTYLNASDKKQTVKLDKSMKQAEIDKFAKIMYGGTTPCKVQQAADRKSVV